jgi:hypothetical protein
MEGNALPSVLSLFFDMLLICTRYVIIAPNLKVHNGHVVSFRHIPILLFSTLSLSSTLTFGHLSSIQLLDTCCYLVSVNMT